MSLVIGREPNACPPSLAKAILVLNTPNVAAQDFGDKLPAVLVGQAFQPARRAGKTAATAPQAESRVEYGRSRSPIRAGAPQGGCRLSLIYVRLTQGQVWLDSRSRLPRWHRDKLPVYAYGSGSCPKIETIPPQPGGDRPALPGRCALSPIETGRPKCQFRCQSGIIEPQ